jgi:hypothetical protein
MLLFRLRSPSLTKFIESSGKPLPFVPKDEFAEAYTNFIKKRFYQIKILLANMYNNSFFKKILVVACVVFLYCDKDYNSIGDGLIGDNHFDFVIYIKRCCLQSKIGL